MKKSKFTEEQTAYALRQVMGGTLVGEVCRVGWDTTISGSKSRTSFSVLTIFRLR